MKFTQLKLNEKIQKALNEINYIDMTDVQEKAIPIILEGNDIIVQSPTGTGKTCTFALPTLEKVDTKNKNLQVLVLCPTRELARQSSEEYKKLSTYVVGFNSLSVYGGQDIRKQIDLLKKKPQVIVSTPGRLLDLIKRKKIDLKTVSTVVLDEADEMLNMGFEKDIKAIMALLTDERQTLLLSATMPKRIIDITKNYQTNPIKIKANIDQNNLPKINQYYVSLKEKDKMACLCSLLKREKFKLVLVFTNMKIKASRISKTLSQEGIKADCIHSDLKQTVRDKVMKKFKNGEISILVATDVAARGIDVNDIDAVINFDMPEDLDFYVHRIGRTGRNKKEGKAITFLSKNLRNSLKDIYKVTSTDPILMEVEYDTDFNPRENVQSGWHRFFLNFGKKDGIRDIKDLLHFIAKNTDIEFNNVQDIKLLDAFCFVNVLQRDIGKILRLKDKKIKGRTINVEECNGESNSNSSNNKRRSKSEPWNFEKRESNNYKNDSRRDQGSAKPKDGWHRFFLNFGKKDGIRDIKDFLNLVGKNTNIDFNGLQNVTIKDSFCFVNIDKKNIGKLMQLKKVKINDRQINVEESEQK